MAGSDDPRHVSIFNSRPDFIEALRAALERDGSTALCAHLADIQSGTLDLVAYDLPRPYETHLTAVRKQFPRRAGAP